MGNCVTVGHGTTWVDGEEDAEFSERRNLLRGEPGVTAVRIRIKRKELEELLSNKRLSAEKVLEEMMRRKVRLQHAHVSDGHWKPQLQSIAEVQDER